MHQLSPVPGRLGTGRSPNWSYSRGFRGSLAELDRESGDDDVIDAEFTSR
jgi:hypothetical protein